MYVLTVNGLGAADGVVWGRPDNSIRLGIGFGPDSTQPELRVVLQNIGSTAQYVRIGHQVGTQTAVDLKFLATTPEGKTFEGFEINSFTPVAGLVLPVMIKLEPGATHEWRFPMKNIICVQKPGNVTFDALVNMRSSIRVSLEAYEGPGGNESVRWLGKVASGRLSPVE